MRHRIPHRAGGAALPALLLALPALAQVSTNPAPAAAGLDEIVVTATRREERLQDVPISVSAFGQEKLDAAGLRSIDDLSRLSPGVAFVRNGMGSSSNYNDEGSDINIRGVDSTAGTSTTGIYIDDTPIQSRHIGFGAVNAFPQLFDLDRVEVLRGPQGTLFGAGAEGGVVRFIAPAPDLNKESAYVRAEVADTQGGAPSYESGAAFGAPIIDGVLAFRVSASFRRDGGWVDRVNYTQNPAGNPAAFPGAPFPSIAYAGTTESAANWQETSTFRAALTWKAGDALTITPSFYYQRLQINDTAAYWPSLSDPSSGVFRNGNALTNPSTDPFWLASVKLAWDLGFGQLTSNTSYYSRDQHSVSDYTQYLRATYNLFGLLANTYPAAAGDQGYAPFRDQQRNIYEEIKVASVDADAPLRWTAGFFFSHLDENVPEDIIDPTLNQEVTTYSANLPGGPFPVCSATLPCPGGQIFHGPTDRVVDRQFAVFGELGYRFTQSLRATLGLRVSKIDYTGSVNATGPFLGETIVTSSSSSENPITPKAVLSWQPDKDDLLYASAAKGFRPGGVNVGVGQICGGSLGALGINSAPGTFASDSLWSYELGSKNSFMDRRLQINTSLFYIDWSNIQQNVYLPTCGEQFTANLGKVASRGGDIEVQMRPIEQLTLDLTAAYTDAKFTKTSCAGASTYSATAQVPGYPPGQLGGCVGGAAPVLPIVSQGDRLFGAPWSFTASAEYLLPEWVGTAPYVRFDLQHSTAQKGLISTVDTRNALADPTLPELPVVNNLNMRAGMRLKGFDLSLFANNLTNSQPVLFASRDIAPSPYTASPTDLLYFERGVRPRTVGLTGTYRY